jgi:TonB family protein
MTAVPDHEWGPGRWLVTVLSLAGLMGASVAGLTRWPALPPTQEIAHPDYLFDPRPPAQPVGELLPLPTGFALADPKGFSGAAERLRPGQAYTIETFKAAPRWLGMDPSAQRLGQAAPLAAIPPKAERLPVPAMPLASKPAPLVSASTVVATGAALGGRALLKIATVPPPVGEVLPASVVEVGVNPWGQVIVARLIGSSGSPTVDQAAVAAARGALFSPLPGRLKAAESALTELQWGRLNFNWGGGLPLR